MSRDGPVDRIPYVALGGVPLQLDVGEEHSWTITSGTQPFQAVFEATAWRARAIFERGKAQFSDASTTTRTRDKPAPVGPISFEIESPGRPKVEIKGLYVLATQPGRNVNRGGVLISDQRWLWKRILAEKVYNRRRRAPEFRLLQGDVTPAQVTPRAPDYYYARASLKDGRPWTAREILEDVLTELCGQGGYVFDDEPELQETIESLFLRGPGDEQLQRVLGFLPGMDVYPHPDGKIHVYNRLKNGEVAAATKAGSPLWGTGNWTVVDKSLIRPRRVRVYFGRELETRFTYLEDEQGNLRSISPGREPRDLENVLPCPDPVLTLRGGRQVAMGTWITIQEALDAWQDLADAPAGQVLTQKKIRRHYMAGLAFLHHLFTMQVGTSEVNQVWARRINAIQEHWRRTFRVLPQWRDKVRSFRAYRVAIVDQENGTRARAEAYFDHVVKLGARGLMKFQKGDELGWNTESWAEDLADAKVAPAEVQVLDEENGIIHVSPRLDLGGLAVAVAPGTVEADEIPKVNAGEATTLWSKVHLDDAWKLSLVITCVQDVPNDIGRLHEEIVTPDEAMALLPGAPKAGTCRAPDFETMVSEAVETARWAWVDAQETALEEVFFDGKPPPPELMINPEIVRALARAQAARVYALSLDRGEGSFAVSLKAGIVPTGSLQQVTYKASRPDPQTVLCTTTLVMPPVVVQPGLSALLPESVRRVVQRLVQQ